MISCTDKKSPTHSSKNKLSRKNIWRNKYATIGQSIIASLALQLIFIPSTPFHVNAIKNATKERSNTLCNILVLLPFELPNPTRKKQAIKQFPSTLAFGQMASAVMAKEHFNTQNSHVIQELNTSMYDNCKVDIIFGDVGHSASQAASVIQKVYDNLDDNSEICGVVGPYLSKAIIASSILSAGRNVPILSYHASTLEIGTPHIRPLSASLIPRTEEKATEMIDYIVNARKRNFIVLLYFTIDLSYLSGAFEEAIRALTPIYGEIKFVPIAISSPLKESFESATKKIKELGYKTVIVALSRLNQWDDLYATAEKENMTSKESAFVWISYDTVDIEMLSRPANKQWEKNKHEFWKANNYTESQKKRHIISRAKLLNGAGYFRVLDGFEEYEDLEDKRHASEGYRFLESWKDINKTLVQNSAENLLVQNDVDKGNLADLSDNYFDEEHLSLTRYSGYMYDAIIALGIGKCRASLKEFSSVKRCSRNCESQWPGPAQYPNTGTNDLLFNILGRNITFNGVTGSVVLNNKRFYTRNASTVSYGIYNIRITDRNSVLKSLHDMDQNTSHTYEFEYVLTSVKKPFDKEWMAPLNDEMIKFIFADNTTREPTPLIDPPDSKTPSWFIATITSLGSVLLLCIFGGLVYFKTRGVDDSIWAVHKSELTFGELPQMIGMGTFGVVHLAEYRGTQVAIKKVIPPRPNTDKVCCLLKDESEAISGSKSQIDIELEGDLGKKSGVSVEDLGIYVRKSGDRPMGKNGKAFVSTSLSTQIGNSADTSRSHHKSLKHDFILEMRHLSKLRHPCIVTLMGAVISRKEEPLLVMEYMQNGSLYDLLHNNTLLLDGDLVLPMLNDISQGLRFLHAATPKVIHGDLKAKNVLVDSKFRAKVSDFGLSQKKRLGATGTPYWMAPELLRGECNNSTSTDVYSFGMILFEVYSRKDPYEGEDYKKVLQAVADPNVNKRPEVPSSCPPQVRSLFADCLLKNSDDRPNMEEVDVRLKRMDVDSAEPGRMLFSKQLKKEHRLTLRTEELLFDVFPTHIAEALRDGRKVEPESRNMVTIFFSDIVGFTKISSTLTPIKISEMLDRLYHKFDELSRKHDIFKVETIGDAYMAVTNLVKDQANDHAKRIADFSIDALKAANETIVDIDDESKGYINIRVGFHSGPVVANVVGSRNPRYCLFGDTVNTASRMESNSLMNRIHCSEIASHSVRQQYPEMRLLSRGLIAVKGKGEMHTYWVNESSVDQK